MKITLTGFSGYFLVLHPVRHASGVGRVGITNDQFSIFNFQF